jgi:hypothetical protein
MYVLGSWVLHSFQRRHKILQTMTFSQAFYSCDFHNSHKKINLKVFHHFEIHQVTEINWHEKWLIANIFNTTVHSAEMSGLENLYWNILSSQPLNTFYLSILFISIIHTPIMPATYCGDTIFSWYPVYWYPIGQFHYQLCTCRRWINFNMTSTN